MLMNVLGFLGQLPSTSTASSQAMGERAESEEAHGGFVHRSLSGYGPGQQSSPAAADRMKKESRSLL